MHYKLIFQVKIANLRQADPLMADFDVVDEEIGDRRIVGRGASKETGLVHVRDWTWAKIEDQFIPTYFLPTEV